MNQLLICYAVLTITGLFFIIYLVLEISIPEKDLFKKLPAKVNGKEYTYYTVLPEKYKPLICLN